MFFRTPSGVPSARAGSSKAMLRCMRWATKLLMHSQLCCCLVHSATTGETGAESVLAAGYANAQSLRGSSPSMYSSNNGTIEVGVCDQHLLCTDILASYVDHQSACPPENVLCQKSVSFSCTKRPDVYVKHNCRLVDCLGVRELLTDASGCNQWFPEIVQSAMNRNPAEFFPKPDQVMGKNDETAPAHTFPRPLGATCVLGANAETCSSTCCGQRGPLKLGSNPPEEPRCVMPHTTRLGAYCVSDCQCETGYCNVSPDGGTESPANTCQMSEFHHGLYEPVTGGPRGDERETIGDFRMEIPTRSF